MTCKNLKSFGALSDIASFSFLDQNFQNNQSLKTFTISGQLHLFFDVSYVKIGAFSLPANSMKEKRKKVTSLHKQMMIDD